jgi:hypothetical protein
MTGTFYKAADKLAAIDTLADHVVVPRTDHLRLLQLLELDDTLVTCETRVVGSRRSRHGDYG